MIILIGYNNYFIYKNNIYLKSETAYPIATSF